MKPSIITIKSSVVESSDYGTKAHWLSWLVQEQYNVPWAIFIPATDIAIDSISQDPNYGLSLQELRESLKPFLVGDKYSVAVRSSAPCEDTELHSFAGHFKTVIGDMSFDEVVTNIKQVIDSSKQIKNNPDTRMGVIIQKQIKAQFSGVAFSSNPLTGSKLQSMISVVTGMGEGLVSGRVEGEDILVTQDDTNLSVPPYKTNLDKQYVEKIYQIAKEIEKKLCYPIDIEWCIEEETGNLYILQTRPVTDVFHQGDSIVRVSLANQQLFPNSVANNHKVELRLTAEKTNIMVSKANLVIINHTESALESLDLSILSPTQNCKAYSVVLIQPRTLSGKVVRRFVSSLVSKDTSENESFEIPQQYTVVSSPEYSNVKDSITDIVKDCSKEYWLSILIVQEVFDPKYSGIIKAIPEGYIIELARGHFIPKGAVSTSQYVVDVEGRVLYKTEVYQDKLFKIVNGYVLSENSSTTDEALVSLSEQGLGEIVERFKLLLVEDGTAVEFGVLEAEDSNEITPYLIDLIEEDSDEIIDLQSISSGIISKGTVTGKLIVLNEESNPEDTLNRHFHDVMEIQVATKEAHIFLCQRPDISLLKIIETYDHKKLGFIFREGSVLCHLALVLREKGIPAIVFSDPVETDDNQPVIINANINAITRYARAS